ncbi:MAG: S8 family serine peptidase [Pseudomonadota bacterium]
MTMTPANNGADSTGVYAPFKALWHLEEIGVLENLNDFNSSAWDDAHTRIVEGNAPATRVALIDTSVDDEHPNLKNTIAKDLGVDFFSHKLGLPILENKGDSRLGKIVKKGEVDWPEHLPDDARKFWEDMIEHLDQHFEKSSPEKDHSSKVKPATSKNFSAHGTAMAGLIGAQPVTPADSNIKMVVNPDAEGTLGLAYAGVDPFCEIIPISTNFNPEPQQLILTMLYSVLVEADLIVLARDFPKPVSLVLQACYDSEDDKRQKLSEALGVGLRKEEMEEWDLLEELVIAVSTKIPVLCAAGNGGDDLVLFPASLARNHHGIIAVGARTAAGQRSAFTPESNDVTVYGPSGDGERLDKRMQRIDTVAVGYRAGEQSSCYSGKLHTYPHENPPDEHSFAPQELISTDVPGRAGYNSSPFAKAKGKEDKYLDYRSCFCRFSGTSGAVAVAAGLVSLAISAGKVTAGNVSEIREKLTGNAPAKYKTAEPAIAWKNFTQ